MMISRQILVLRIRFCRCAERNLSIVDKTVINIIICHDNGDLLYNIYQLLVLYIILISAQHTDPQFETGREHKLRPGVCCGEISEQTKATSLFFISISIFLNLILSSV